MHIMHDMMAKVRAGRRLSISLPRLHSTAGVRRIDQSCEAWLPRGGLYRVASLRLARFAHLRFTERDGGLVGGYRYGELG